MRLHPIVAVSRAFALSLPLLALHATIRASPASPSSESQPPTSWIDPDTGHRVIRLTREPGSDSLYFNLNGYTPDGKEMVYSTRAGISVLDLPTHAARQVVAHPARAIEIGRKTPTLYYTKPTETPDVLALWSANLQTGETRKILDLPPRATISTINADETLGAGTFIEGNANAGGAFDGTADRDRRSPHPLGGPLNKAQKMEQRLAAKLPMTLFTVDLRTRQLKRLIEHSTDWLNHLQFSPTDPTLLMYCHEGLWWRVDRIWTIRTDGTQNQLVHRRRLEMEMAGHEWWGADGQTIFYQLHFRGMPISFVASYDVRTHARTWLYYPPENASIHDNSSPDGKLFCGDGDRSAPWIFLFRPVPTHDPGTLGHDLIKTGVLAGEKLVNLSKHNYHLEPNPSFTPDEKFVVFRSNLFGPDYVFAVEVAKAR